jgi:hypothetical protein
MLHGASSEAARGRSGGWAGSGLRLPGFLRRVSSLCSRPAFVDSCTHFSAVIPTSREESNWLSAKAPEAGKPLSPKSKTSPVVEVTEKGRHSDDQPTLLSFRELTFFTKCANRSLQKNLDSERSGPICKNQTDPELNSGRLIFMYFIEYLHVNQSTSFQTHVRNLTGHLQKHRKPENHCLEQAAAIPFWIQ